MERKSKKIRTCCPQLEDNIECDGHFLEDAAKDSKQWFATRCWGWNNGFKGDPVAIKRFLRMAEETKEAVKAAEEDMEAGEASAEDEPVIRTQSILCCLRVKY